MIIKSIAIFISVFAIAIANTAESEKHMKYSILAIEYIGESDKPITPIVISDSEAGAEWARRAVLKRDKWDLTDVHVVNAALLEKLIAEVGLFERTVHLKPEKISKSAKTLSATIITPHGKNTFLYGTESAISLLESFQKHCKGDESLRSDLLHFQNRIHH
jgi:hypothetical protein